MSCNLSKDLRAKYAVRSIPVRKGDTIKVMRGNFPSLILIGTQKGKEGKVNAVYRKKWVLHIEKLTREKHNG
jgi:ribosomal protein uL24